MPDKTPAPPKAAEAKKPESPKVTAPPATATATPQMDKKNNEATKPAEREDFSSVLTTVNQLRRDRSRPSAETPQGSLEEQVARALGTPGGGPHSSQAPITMGEIEAVRRQIERCWNLPAGAKDAQELTVAVRVEMNPDGTPRTARVEDPAQSHASPFQRATAESAVRAVLNPRCHPFKLPPEKYDRWRTMTLVFNPRDMAGS